MSEIVDLVLKRLGISSRPTVSCNFCDEPSVSSYQVRIGEIPIGWTYKPVPADADNDKSRMVVVRVCDAHRPNTSSVALNQNEGPT